MASTTTYTLDQYKTDQEKLLESRRQAAIQEANVSNQKLLKYLPQGQRAAAAGYSQGLSETARINAENSRLRAIAQAENDYTTAYSELLNNYRTEKKAEQDAAYNEAVTMIDSQTWNTTDELKKYLYGDDGVSGVTAGMTDAQRQQLAQRLEYYRSNPEQQAADEEYYMQPVVKDELEVTGYLDNLDEGNNFKIGGYKVELGTQVTTLPSSKISDIAEGQVFAYNGALYIKKNGSIYSVQGRGAKLDSDDYKALLARYSE